MRSKWARLDCLYYFDDKVMRVNPLAELLYVRLIAYTVAMQTDGAIPLTALDVVGRGLGNRQTLSKLLGELETVHLIASEQDHSYSFPASWKAWQESAGRDAVSRTGGRVRAGEGGRVRQEQSRTEQTRAEQSMGRESYLDPSLQTSPPSPAERDKLTAVLDGLAHKWNGAQWEEDSNGQK